MKLWIKYLLGVLLGIAAAFILPSSSASVEAFVQSCFEFAVRFGRYTLLPLLFFSVSSALFTIRKEKMLLKTGFWIFAAIVGTTFLLTILGLFSILIVKLPRIPITGEKVTEIATISLHDLIMQILPYSSFDSIREGAYLLPAFIFAGLAGAGAASDTIDAKPVITLFDSAAALCYSIMTFFLEFLAIGMVAVSAWWMMGARTVFASGTFIPLTLMLLIDLILVAGVIYPLILYFLCHDLHPYKTLYACICPVLTAFFAADSNLNLQVNLRHGRESLGIENHTASVSYNLFSIFGRGGTSLVTTICFITILRSYSSLGFSPADVLWIFVMTFSLSFVLCAIPRGGTFIALTILCIAYSRGFEAGYLLLRPASAIFCSFAAAFDALSAMFGSYVVAVKTRTIEHVDLKHYI